MLAAPMSNVVTPELIDIFVQHGGLGIGHRWMDPDDQVAQIRRTKGRFVAVVGLDPVNQNLDKAKRYIDEGASGILIDVNISWTKKYIDFVGQVAQLNPKALIVGNIDQSEAVIDMFLAGATTVKIGVGPASHCSTRSITPIGFPQANAIAECAWMARRLGMYVIGDGGISTSSRKNAMALALGADMVMTGRVFAASDEGAAVKVFRPLDWLIGRCARGLTRLTASETVERLARWEGRYAEYHGMAEKRFQDQTSGKIRPGQGYKSLVVRTGSASAILDAYRNELKVALASVGAGTLEDLRSRAEFYGVGESYQAESGHRRSR